MFVVDGSAQEQALVYSFIRQLVSRLDIGADNTRIAVVNSRQPHVQINLNDYVDKSLLLNAIDSLAPLTTTAAVETALQVVRQDVTLPLEAGESPRPTVVFVIVPDSLDLDDASIVSEFQMLVTSTRQVMLLLYGNTQSDVIKNEQGGNLVSSPPQQNLLLYASAEALLLTSVVNDVITLLCQHIPSRLTNLSSHALSIIIQDKQTNKLPRFEGSN